MDHPKSIKVDCPPTWRRRLRREDSELSDSMRERSEVIRDRRAGFMPEARSAAPVTLLIVLVDLAAVALAFMLAVQLRMRLPFPRPFTHTFVQYVELWPILLLWPVVIWREGLYRGLWLPDGEHLKRIVQATTVASMVVMAATFVTKTGPQYSRAVVIGGWLLSMPALAMGRFVLKRLLTRLGFAGPPVVILGAGIIAQLVLQGLAKQRPPSLSPVAIFDDDETLHGADVRGIPVVASIPEAEGWCRARGVKIALVADAGRGQAAMPAAIEEMAGVFRRVIIIPDLLRLSSTETTARDVGGVLALEVKKNLTYPHNKIAKRVLELLITVALAPFLLILTAVIAFAIALESGRPILFRQQRLGYQGQSLNMWKFRTMVEDAESELEKYLEDNPSAREEWGTRQKLEHDPRLTNVGRFLRRFSLDEMPQMVNVLQGKMSLVGPRPILMDQVALYGPALGLYKQVRPGLTGLWQVSGRASTTFHERADMDQYYIRNWSVWQDLIIIARTLWTVVSGRGAY